MGFEEGALVRHLGAASSHQPLAPREHTRASGEIQARHPTAQTGVASARGVSGDSGHTLGTSLLPALDCPLPSWLWGPSCYSLHCPSPFLKQEYKGEPGGIGPGLVVCDWDGGGGCSPGRDFRWREDIPIGCTVLPWGRKKRRL